MSSKLKTTSSNLRICGFAITRDDKMQNEFGVCKGKRRWSRGRGWGLGMVTLRRTTVSMVRPGPKPKSTPQSSPSPVVLSPSSRDFFLIKSMMKNTHALDILP
ncbi:hypothetical protein Ahy_Scaffold6g107961 [Arachis hypogaea]|uniref:Uncharacterized protein n=1 Tax=Arachis hypogaea TaxID=3818 RepID=A0A444WP17_ARAHY|nr:hypothetical protein Ahy_Scaffold6g107961 [Arachis hypogaea]